MDLDDKVNAFRRRLQELDAIENGLALKMSNEYRALSPVTYGETRFEQTGFRPVEGDAAALPDDSTIPQILGVNVVAQAVPFQGPITVVNGGPLDGQHYSVAYNSTLSATATVYYTDGTSSEVPTGTIYHWTQYIVPQPSPQFPVPILPISNADKQVASVSVPSGRSSFGQAYQFFCTVTLPTGEFGTSGTDDAVVATYLGPVAP